MAASHAIGVGDACLQYTRSRLELNEYLAMCYQDTISNSKSLNVAAMPPSFVVSIDMGIEIDSNAPRAFKSVHFRHD